jgi:hypothetical protein
MKSPSISGDVFADKPPAYVGKTLHVAVDITGRSEFGEWGVYTVWTNDGNEPIARCIDSGTAHLLAEASDLRKALLKIYDEVPSRPNMTEAGRVAMMAEIARAALDAAGAL